MDLMNQRGIAPIFMIVGILAIISVVGGVYYVGTQKSSIPLAENSQINNQLTQSSPTSLDSNEPIPTVVTNGKSIKSNQTPLPTESGNTQVNVKATLLTTADWQTISAKNFSIQAPANLVPFVSDPYLVIIRQQKEYVAEKPQFSAAQVGIPEMGDQNNLYIGGSRRQWYLDYHCKYNDEPCPYTFKEKMFGNYNGLEVYSENTRVAVLVTVGTKLFQFNGSSGYAQIIDAAISTLRVN